MKQAQKETLHSVVHIDCYEPRLAQVRRIVSAFPQDVVSLFQYTFKRGPGALPPEMRQTVSTISHHTREKIALIFSVQLLDKTGCDELLNDIKLFHQQVLVLLYTCLEEKEVREKYKDLLSIIHEPLAYVEYDEEKAGPLPSWPVGRVILQDKLQGFLFPEKK